jgi:hypothetical protein
MSNQHVIADRERKLFFTEDVTDEIILDHWTNVTYRWLMYMSKGLVRFYCNFEKEKY